MTIRRIAVACLFLAAPHPRAGAVLRREYDDDCGRFNRSYDNLRRHGDR
jgi:hypothetical protein